MQINRSRKIKAKKELRFRGFLTNTDSSILKLKLEHGFKIRALSDTEACDFIKMVEKVSVQRACNIIFIQYPCLNSEEKKAYVIDASIEADVETKASSFFNVTARFDNKFIHGYLKPTLQLLRLFKEGNIRIPFYYYYVIKNGKPSSFSGLKSPRSLSTELYCIENSELEELNSFLHETKLPFKDPFLQLALENYDLSYKISNRALSFLTLIISIETLLNPGKSEVLYRISRNAAVLLGANEDESKEIFLEIKQLYDKRSKVIHAGKSNSVKKEDLLKLSNYVRETIKKMYLMKKSKKEILDLLNSSGFGKNLTA